MSKIETLEIYTDGSARPIENVHCAGWGVFITEPTLNLTFEGSGSSGMGGTNNMGEMDGLIQALTKVLELKPKSVLINIDSMYVITGYTKLMDKWNKDTNWLNKQGGIVKNKDRWQKLIELRDKCKAEKIKITIKWVKGHSSNKGNDTADRLARKGAELCSRNLPDAWNSLGEVSDDGAVMIKKKKAIKVPPVPGFFHGKFISFVTNTKEARKIIGQRLGGMTPYLLSEFEDKKDEAIAGAYFGKPNAGACYSAVFLKEPFAPVEDIMEAQESAIEGDDHYPVLINKAQLFSKKTLEEYVTSGKEMFCVNGGQITQWGNEILTQIRNPALLAGKAFATYDLLIERAVQYVSRSDSSIHYTDVTDHFISTNDKGAQVVNPSFESRIKAMKVTASTTEGDLNVTLSIGIDLPTRNDIGRLVRAGKDVKVTVAVGELLNGSFRHWQIIESSEGIAIYQSPHSSFKVRANKPKKK